MICLFTDSAAQKSIASEDPMKATFKHAQRLFIHFNPRSKISSKSQILHLAGYDQNITGNKGNKTSNSQK